MIEKLAEWWLVALCSVFGLVMLEALAYVFTRIAMESEPWWKFPLVCAITVPTFLAFLVIHGANNR